ncbi:hypothetical protein Q31a_46680 [Aureliella helgolandensis]|uniref:Uncharacterized protein n=1 Tax=Aureliella helgolandensis TaxID=2527968 RepID=A0A518GCH0_9BACT|nr:hypothetical protein Q31a_46680 [Aureliella helgolandensis]
MTASTLFHYRQAWGVRTSLSTIVLLDRTPLEQSLHSAKEDR